MKNTPTQFESISSFVDALNDYKGESIWQDLIYGAEIEGNEVDAERSTEADGCIIYLTSGDTIIYSESKRRGARSLSTRSRSTKNPRGNWDAQQRMA